MHQPTPLIKTTWLHGPRREESRKQPGCTARAEKKCPYNLVARALFGAMREDDDYFANKKSVVREGEYISHSEATVQPGAKISL